MSTLHRVSDGGPASTGSAVFVPGLGGDPYKTWEYDGTSHSFWLNWLSEDIRNVSIYTLEYDAGVSDWFRSSMGISDRATNVAAEMMANGLDEAPLIFVCHSLGGILIKQLLRLSADRSSADKGRLVQQTRGAVFLGTPNSGSDLANWANIFRALIRPSTATKGLVTNDPYLRDLNIWYRDNAPDRGIATLAFSETRPLKGVIVVNQSSADPEVKGVRPIPLDTDHSGVSKPESRDATLYKMVHRFIEEQFSRNPFAVGDGFKAAVAVRPGAGTENFDVFISHSNAQREWVETLARNLQSAGKTVFLDLWRLIPGKDWVQGLRSGLASCRAAILVVSPEAMASGWVRHEYEILKSRQVDDPDFIIIPVIHSSVDGDAPFTGSIQWVDFRYQSKQIESFARLLAGLERRAPGPSPTYDAAFWLPLPAPKEQFVAAAASSAIDDAFRRLFNAQAVLILAQEGLGSAAISREILRRAVERFGKESVIQLTPSYVAPEDGLAPYFESLAVQANLSTDSPSAVSFQRQIASRLKDGSHLCMLFSGVEHSSPAALSSLCSALRSLNERYSSLRVLMCGGERLCDMRYAEGALSYFSHAQEVLWPDPAEAEIRAEAKVQGLEEIDPKTVNLIKELSGGHLGVTRELLTELAAGKINREALRFMVLDSPTLWASVMSFSHNREEREIVLGFCERTDLGVAQRYIANSTLRRLFWLNLITRMQSEQRIRLVWRSTAIRDAVREILSGSN